LSKEANKQTSIDNLRSLAKLASENSLTSMLKEIKVAKQSLEAVHKKVSIKYQDHLRQIEIAENAKRIDEKFEVKQAPKQEVKPDAGNRAPRPFDANKKPQGSFNRDNNKPFNKPYDKKPFNKPFERKPFNKPYDKKPGASPTSTTKPTDSPVKNKFANKPTTKAKTYDKKQRGYNKKQLMRRGLVEERSIAERMMNRRLKVKKPKQQVLAEKKIIEHGIITTDNLTVKVLAESIGKPVNEIVKQLFLLGIMGTINSSLEFETAELVANELGITIERKVGKTFEEKLQDEVENTLLEEDADATSRPPIVTVMGHVDHGKTSLLDAIRQTSVTTGEAGGITQHIGAYTVKTKKGQVTFIDTPGHAAFTEMRARGAKVTDIAILVVAADDGIMPQTIEAINHIKAADVPMVVAINKIDKAGANIEKIKQQLADHDVLAEEWGGDTIVVPVSAITKEGIDKLLEMLLLVSEMKELKANADKKAVGTIIEARLDKGKGPIATIIIQNGTLRVGDTVVSGLSVGRIRAMMDENGNPVKLAGPATPVAVLGFDSVPQAGDFVNAVDDKMSRQLIEERKAIVQLEKMKSGKIINLDDIFSQVQEGALKSLNLIVKAGVMGVVEALKTSLLKLKNEEFKVNIVHGGAGAINENDVLLAQASNAIIIGFNVKPDNNAKKLAEQSGVDIRFYKIIYNVIDDIEAAMKGMLAPKFEEIIQGHAEVVALFKVSKIGTIAGCMVKDGKITRNSSVRLLRENVVVADSTIETLRIQKDDKTEVKAGFECGIKLKDFNDIKEGDIFEAYIEQQIKV
jgi:translation initiation factor IF-2